MGFLDNLMLCFSLLVILLSSKSHFLDSEIVTDKEALISLKSQLVMELPNLLSDWNQDSSPCNWTRVVCDKFYRRVEGLDLAGLQLRGSISPFIGNLTSMRSLQLQNNSLTGNLPRQLGNLVHLQLLNVSFNSIRGGIPEEISQLKELQVLNLASNQLSGAIPSSIANISSLTILNLRTNNLSGLIPCDLARLKNLKTLDLSINNLWGTVPNSIYNMSTLLFLAMALNNLSGEFPSNMGLALPNLLYFNFCLNIFTGTIPRSLHNLTSIKIIRVSYNLLDGSVPPGVWNLPDLETYNIGSNRLVSSGENGLSFLDSLANSTHLRYLSLENNLFEGKVPQSIGNFSKVLKKIYMGGNRIYGSIPSSIGQLRDLGLLILSYNSISGEIPPEIGQLKELQVLGLAGNHLSGKIPNSLGNLQKLFAIDISENKLMGNIPTAFGNFQNLLSMDLSKNKLVGFIPKEIFHLSSLSLFLNLSQNSLSGSLPQEIGLLENVIAVDISDNHLTGGIPNSIGDCGSLEHLILAKNMLSGQIPSSLGAVKGLETLDLSSNKLSGGVPLDLQKLQALKQLNLSFNNLEGKIPSGGIFAQPSGVHLEGNQKLCLQLTCENGGSNQRRLIFAVTATTIAAIFSVFITLAVLFVLRKGRANIKATSESFIGQHQLISYDELRHGTKNFDKENLIGTGSFGSVYKGFLQEGMPVAVKVINTETTGSWKSFLAECTALKHLRHRNLIKVITSCSSIDFSNVPFLALVYELMSNGSLDDWISGKRRTISGEGLNVLDRLNVAIDVATAVNYLHNECEVPMVHCDLKPANVLLDSDMTAKIGDFGLARFLIKTSDDQPPTCFTNTLKGSIGYIPPDAEVRRIAKEIYLSTFLDFLSRYLEYMTEYGSGMKPSTAGDVYSFGIMLLELFTGRSPRHESFSEGLSLKMWVQMNFQTKMEEVLDQNLLIFNRSPVNDNSQSINSEILLGDCLIEIIQVGLSCVTDSPERRLTMKDALHKLKSVKDALVKKQLVAVHA